MQDSNPRTRRRRPGGYPDYPNRPFDLDMTGCFEDAGAPVGERRWVEAMEWASTPCIEKGCSRCCEATEMPLSPGDVRRLVGAQGLHPDAFSIEVDGTRRLRNDPARDVCVFLDAEGLCTVFEHRPLGCRFYPLVLDEEDEAFLDDLCPHRADFPDVPPGMVLALARLAEEIGA